MKNDILHMAKPNFSKLPPELTQCETLHLWKKGFDPNGNLRKIPCDPHGRNMDPFDPDIYLNLSEAVKHIEAKAGKYGIAITLGRDGLSIVVNDSKRYLWCFDFDGFMDMNNLEIDTDADTLCQRLQTYTEDSDSGTGLKSYFWSDKPPCTKFDIKFCDSKYAAQFPEVRKYTKRTIEVFSNNRFLALSGNRSFTHLTDLRFIPSLEVDAILAKADSLAKASGGTGRLKLPEKKTAKSKSTAPKTRNAQLTEQSALLVLKHVNHHDEQTYTDVANAIWRLKGEDGRQLYHECMSGKLANDPYPDYDEQVVDARYDRARDEKRESGYGWPHLIELAKQHPNWNDDAPLEWQSDEFGPLTFTQCGENSGNGADPIDEVNATFVWDRNRMEIYDKRSGIYVKKDGFLTNYKNRNVTINESTRTLGDAWLKHSRRAEVNGLEMAPDQGAITEKGALNIWKGYSCQPVDGDCSPFNAVFGHLIRNGEQAAYVLTWLARMIQNPAEKFNVALICWGLTQGTGKNTIFEAVGELIARQHFCVIGGSQLASDFTDWQVDKVFIIGDEVCGAGDRRLGDKMKRLITATDNTINPKGKPAFNQPNLTKYVLLSNHADAVHIERQDRRYYVVEVTDQRLPIAVANAFYAWKQGGGLSHLLHYLLHYDCSAFDPTKPPPMTEAKEAVINAGRSSLETWVIDEVTSDIARGRLLVNAESLAHSYKNRTGTGATARAVANSLRIAGVRQLPKRAKCKGGGYLRLYALSDWERFASMGEAELGTFYETQPLAMA